MNKFGKFLIGFGFLWLALWGLFGSLLGVQVTNVATSISTEWLSSWERVLLRTAHSHMNSMAIVIILMGVVIRPMGHKTFVLARFAALTLLSVIVFGGGLVYEAFAFAEGPQWSVATALVGLGATGYIVGTIAFGSYFIAGALRK